MMPANKPALPALIVPGQPLTALAPMQDVTTLEFMRVMAHYGAPDIFVTEFFRVHDMSRPEKHILRSIDDNQTGRPVFAQLIGESIPHLERTIALLLDHPVAGIDLNLGCPAPKVYKKNVGGGLLRDPQRVDTLLAALRQACPGLFTVKMRLGFDDTSPFDEILNSVRRHNIDLLTVHGRTVKGGYRSAVDYDLIAHAVRSVPCPVLANGNVTSARAAQQIVAHTNAAGVMIGRHAIRNPWIFSQCREAFGDKEITSHTLGDVHEYVERLYQATHRPDIPERAHVNRMKKFLNFVGQGVDREGRFLHDMRRSHTAGDLFEACSRHLLSDPLVPFADEPYEGVIARPNCEAPLPTACG
jgi:tRNA-dihydrouridine synthase